MRVLGIDHGGRWFGIALSDPSGRFARPLETVDGEPAALERLEQIIAGEGVGRIVVGVPRNMDGSLGRKAQEVIAFAERLRSRVPVPVDTWDERLTTVEAERYLREAGLSSRARRERVNGVAAQILLQSFLDARSSRMEEGGAPGPGGTEGGRRGLREGG